MKLGIMQPYFFPYIGYFQIIKAVDKFIFYDDVNYIKQGWINRNRILLDGKDYMFTLQLEDASSFKKINEIRVGNSNIKLLKTISQAYRKAPYFPNVYPHLEEIILNKEKNLAKFITFSLNRISTYIGIKTGFLLSSEVSKNNDLKGEEKVIAICNKLEGRYYINAIGGKELYSKERFLKENIDLRFLKSKSLSYKQFNNEFIPWLSIIDVMMFNSPEQIRVMLDDYCLI